MFESIVTILPQGMLAIGNKRRRIGEAVNHGKGPSHTSKRMKEGGSSSEW